MTSYCRSQSLRLESMPVPEQAVESMLRTVIPALVPRKRHITPMPWYIVEKEKEKPLSKGMHGPPE